MDSRMTVDLTMIDPVLRDVMLSGGIKALMPLSCLKEGDRVTGIYSTTDKVMVSEGIEFNHPNYKEEKGKVNIYLFRGKSCTYCRRFLTFLERLLTNHFGTFVKRILTLAPFWNSDRC